MRAAVALAIVAILAGTARAQSVVLDVPFSSYHAEREYTDDGERRTVNEVNPGLAVTTCHRTCWTAGLYRNSQRDLSAAVLYGREWPANGNVRAGIDVGAAFGYERFPIVPIVAPTVSIQLVDRWRVKAMMLPVRHPIFGFRLQYLIK